MNQLQIEQLYDEFRTPMHVRKHCLQVGLVGELLAKAFNEAGIQVNTELVYQAGLLHDFVRVVDFKEIPADLGDEKDRMIWDTLRADYHGQHHGKVAQEILCNRGEDELGDVIARHQTSLIGTPQGPNSWESKLVFYADKRVSHDEIVSLDARLHEGWNRHFNGREKNAKEQAIHDAVYKLEKEIFREISLTPNDITRLLA